MPSLTVLTAIAMTFVEPAGAEDLKLRLVRCRMSRWGSTFRVQYVPPNYSSMTCDDVCATTSGEEVCYAVTQASSCVEYSDFPARIGGRHQAQCQSTLQPGRACSCAPIEYARLMTDPHVCPSCFDALPRSRESYVHTCVEGVVSSTLLVLEGEDDHPVATTCSNVCAESGNVRGTCVGHLNMTPRGNGQVDSCAVIPDTSPASRQGESDALCVEEAPSGTGCLCAAAKPLLCGVYKGSPVIVTSKATSRVQCASECAVAGFGGRFIGQFLGNGFDSCEEAIRGAATPPFAQAVGTACRCHGGGALLKPVLAVQRVCGTSPGETRVWVTDHERAFSCNQLCEARDDFWPSNAVCGGTFMSFAHRGVCNNEVPVVASAESLSSDCGRQLIQGDLDKHVCRCISVAH